MNNEDVQWEAEPLTSLPHGVKLSWGYVKQQKRGPKGELSIKQIVEAAIDIADKHGLAALSMNRVAESLGYSAMSLYRYITSKEDLLVLMQDAVCDIPLPPGDPGDNWRESLRHFVRLTIRVYRDHPWFGDIPISGAPITPNNLMIVDWALGAMRGLPLNDFEKMSFVLLLSSYARGAGIVQRDLDRSFQAGASEDSFSGVQYTGALKLLVTSEQYPYLSPVVASGSYTGENDEGNTVGDDFEFGLERTLDGISYYIDRKKAT